MTLLIYLYYGYYLTQVFKLTFESLSFFGNHIEINSKTDFNFIITHLKLRTHTRLNQYKKGNIPSYKFHFDKPVTC